MLKEILHHHDWLKKLVPPYQPIRRKSRINCDLPVTCVYASLELDSCIWFVFLLVHGASLFVVTGHCIVKLIRRKMKTSCSLPVTCLHARLEPRTRVFLRCSYWFIGLLCCDWPLYCFLLDYTTLNFKDRSNQYKEIANLDTCESNCNR